MYGAGLLKGGNEYGYDLIRKSDGENVGSSVWLKDGDNEDNYIEVKEDAENIDN
jgi:hypothetical protein